MNKERFIELYNNLVKNRNGFVPKNIDQWYDDVLTSKEPLKKILPNPNTVIDLEVPAEENPAPSPEIIPHITEVCKILPQYLNTYALSINNFSLPILEKHKGISGAKHILTYAKRNKISKENLQIIEKHLSLMGQVWAKVKFQKISKKITISYCPWTFALLGNFIFDTSSCFGQGNTQNTEKRFALGVYPTLFVVLFHKDNKDIDIQQSSPTIDGRMFGCFTNEFKTLNFCNTYGYASRANIQHFCKEIFKQLTQKNKCQVTSNYFTFTKGLTYVNSYVNSCSDKVVDSMQNCELTMKYYNERNNIK
jgi:hypothetical protein